ncbi:MAG: hypothetical protein JOZ57_12970 [Abitibacteriaceae bacterium]|nr:hypothetical protein [Abditibacteriaceae bacterium]
MKNSGVCPKCESDNVFCIEGTAGGKHDNVIYTGWTVFTYVRLDRYVCGHCGFNCQQALVDCTNIQGFDSAIPNTSPAALAPAPGH